MEMTGYTMSFKKRRVVPPRAKIVDAQNGTIEIRATKKTTPGKYRLVMEAPEWMKKNSNNEIIIDVEVL